MTAAESFAADDPAVRFGEALFETMRAEHGGVAFLGRHLARLERSADALGWSEIAPEEELRSALRRALADVSEATVRVRLTASRSGRVVVETSPIPSAPDPRGITIVGGWEPSRRIAEHKTTSYAANRLAQARADAAGVGHALLLDRRGRLGETANANIVCAIGGEALTPPVRGILPGIAREVVLETGAAVERELPPELWGAADEIVALNALRGVMPIDRVDGRTVGAGRSGLVDRLSAALSASERERP